MFVFLKFFLGFLSVFNLFLTIDSESIEKFKFFYKKSLVKIKAVQNQNQFIVNDLKCIEVIQKS